MKNSMQLTPDERKHKMIELEKRKREAKNDPVALCNHFLYTFNPKEEPYHFPFNLFPFQVDVVRYVQDAINNGTDIMFDKCREMGGTYTILAVMLWFWLYVPGSNFLLGSRKQDLVDNRRGGGGEESNKEESLFGKLDYMISRMPAFMLPKGFNRAKHFTFMSLINPENGNAFSGESSNPNFSRGGRYKATLMDEFAFWENDGTSWGSTADTTDCRIVLTTPGFRASKAKRLRFGTDGETIKVVELPYYLDPRKTEQWLAQQRARRSEEDFAREIMMNWDTSVKGRVYKEIERAEVGKYPYNPDWPLFVSWDFGLDGMAIQWWQKNMKNGKVRLIESYQKEDEPVHYFFPMFPGNAIDSEFDYSSDDLDLFAITSNWKKAIHFGDPDVSKRTIASKEKTSARKELEKAKIYVQTKPESNTFAVRREKTKLLFQKGIEVNKTPGTEIWLEAIQNAHYPQRRESSQATSQVTLPVHDWTSHPRTATEYFAVNYDPTSFEIEDNGKKDYSKYEGYKQEDYGGIL